MEEGISEEFSSALNDGARMERLRRRIMEGLIELQKIRINEDWEGRNVYMSGIIGWDADGKPESAPGIFRLN